MRRCAAILTGLVLLLVISAGGGHKSDASTIWGARVTYFSDVGYMYSGVWTYEGAAACGRAYYLGATVVIHAAWDVWLTCADRGLLGYSQIDVWSPWGRPGWMDQDWYVVDWW